MPYTNPILRGFYPDPSVCRAGDSFYLVTSTMEFFPGVPIFESKDLIHWRQIGHCLTRDSQLPLQNAHPSAGIYAPTIRFHDGLFYMITTNVSHGGNFFVTATDPAGEWSEPTWIEAGGIDPSLFFDDDGRVYLTMSGNGQSEIDLLTGKLLAAPRQVWEGTRGGDMEAPHLYKIGSFYYLIVAEGGTARGHMVTCARSKNPWGPFEPCPHNPILSNRGERMNPVQATGHGDLVQAADGSWWMVFLGVRDVPGRFPRVHTLGRETFLTPVTWTDDGWPVVNGNGTVSILMDVPTLPAHPWAAEPQRDDFDSAAMRDEWMFLRNPSPAIWSLTERPDWLRLKGSALTIEEVGNPAVVFRRQQAHECSASALLDFTPSRPGEEAGMTAYMNAEHHYDLVVTLREGRRAIELRKKVGDLAVVDSGGLLDDGPVTLGIDADITDYTFWYSQGAGERKTIGKGRIRYLSTEVASGFTGVLFGIFATGNRQPSGAPADFDWFDYRDDPTNPGPNVLGW